MNCLFKIKEEATGADLALPIRGQERHDKAITDLDVEAITRTPAGSSELRPACNPLGCCALRRSWPRTFSRCAHRPLIPTYT